jgi:hypothetical protein
MMSPHLDSFWVKDIFNDAPVVVLPNVMVQDDVAEDFDESQNSSKDGNKDKKIAFPIFGVAKALIG